MSTRLYIRVSYCVLSNEGYFAYLRVWFWIESPLKPLLVLKRVNHEVRAGSSHATLFIKEPAFTTMVATVNRSLRGLMF